MHSFFKYTTILPILGFQIVFSQNNEGLQKYEQEPGKEGIYLNCGNLLQKTPIDKSQIKTDIDKDDGEFYGKAVSKPKISFDVNGIAITISTDSVWGFVQNRTLYVNIQGRFFRVPVFGRISYLMAMVEVNQFANAGFDPLTGMPMRVPAKTREMREFIILFDAGCGPFPFDLEKVEKELRKDEEVWNEYEKEKSRNRKKYITKYIRKYNSRNPLN